MAGGDLKLDPHQAHPSCCQMTYTLTCMILGEKTLFPVKINETQLVGELKDKIKEKGEIRFKDIDAFELDLYKLNVAKSDNDYHQIREAITKGLFKLNKTDELDAPDKISRYFADPDCPKDMAIHIVVVEPKGKSIDP